MCSSDLGLFALVIELPTPALTGPAAGATSTDFAPKLAWNLPTGATQVHVQVIPANNDGPGVNLILDADTSLQLAAPKLGVGNYVLLPGITYTWRVRTTSATTAMGENDPGWSSWVTRTFKTSSASANTVSAAAPSNGGMVDSLRPDRKSTRLNSSHT